MIRTTQGHHYNDRPDMFLEGGRVSFNYKPENEMKATIEHCLICGVGLDDENVGSEDITLCEVCEFLEEELDYEEEE